MDLTDGRLGRVRQIKAEGIHRAMNATLDNVPGTKFVYSDINFITLGAIVEKLSGETLDVYATDAHLSTARHSQPISHGLSVPGSRSCDTVGVLRFLPIPFRVETGSQIKRVSLSW